MKKLSKQQKKEINEVLNKIGLNNKESRIYLRLLAFNHSSLTPLSVSLDMPHSTVQSILKKLYDQGLIDVSKSKGRKIYHSLEPTVLKKNLQCRLEEVNNIIPFLENISSDQGGRAKIKIFYRTRMADIFHQVLECKKKEILEIVSPGELQKILGEKFHFTKRRIHRGIKLKSLRVVSDEIKKYNETKSRCELRQAKFLPKELDFKSSFLIWDDNTAFFSSKNEGLAFIIKSKVIANTQRQLFNVLWQLGRHIK